MIDNSNLPVGMIIETGTPDLLPEIVECVRESWISTYTVLMPEVPIEQIFSTEYFLARWDTTLSKTCEPESGHKVFIARKEGTIVGVSACGPYRFDLHPPVSGIPASSGEIYGTYIRPNFQNIGVGRSLITVCCKHLIDLSLTNGCVWRLATNELGKTLYQSYNSQDVITLKGSIGAGIPADMTLLCFNLNLVEMS